MALGAQLSALGIALLVVAGCAKRFPSHLPMTGTDVDFKSLDAGMAGTAPDVASRVTAARLVNARDEPQNWLTYYGAYDGQRYSALDQINATNVRQLRPVWSFQAGVIGVIAAPATYAFEAAPLVVDGVMFLSGFDGYVWALDAGMAGTAPDVASRVTAARLVNARDEPQNWLTYYGAYDGQR